MRERQIRRPGEAVFALAIAAGSLGLLFKAYGISGFESLSSAGALPMAATAVMSICAVLIAWQTWSRPKAESETFNHQILPPSVWIGMILITAYAFMLVPVGFLPTSFLFLVVLIRLLSRRPIGFCLWVSGVSLAAIYLVFRIIFTVIMPEGLIPEARIIAWVGKLLSGAK